MIILRIQIGEQVRYIEGQSTIHAIRLARQDGIPDHLIQTAARFIGPGAWMDVPVDKAKVAP